MSLSPAPDDRLKYGRHLSEMAVFIKSLPAREQSAISNRKPLPATPPADAPKQRQAS